MACSVSGSQVGGGASFATGTAITFCSSLIYLDIEILRHYLYVKICPSSVRQ